MARLRKIEIQNFRSIKELAWLPSAGINCLIGPGDSGKSSILDAIDYCVGARRNIQFTDADFHGLDVERPIQSPLVSWMTLLRIWTFMGSMSAVSTRNPGRLKTSRRKTPRRC